MKAWLLIISIFVLSSVASSQTSGADIQVITKRELEVSGITLLSDIFQLFDKWNISTIDGFNWMVSGNGLSPFQFQRFQIQVDGHPVDLNIMDAQNINALPFSVNQIDSIEVYNTPDLVSGEFAEAGLIHIHLKKPKLKLSSHFVFSTGNETGDPGPYKFTPYSSPNIDKIYNVLAADLDYGSRKWNFQAGLKKEENYDTDQRIKKRIQYFNINADKAQLTSGYLSLSVLRESDRHKIISFYSDHNDYFDLKYYGNEIPVSRINSFVSGAGNLHFNDKFKLNYLLQTYGNKLSKWNGPDPDWNSSKLRSDIALEYHSKSFVFNGGVSLRRNIMNTGAELLQNSISFRNYFLEMRFAPQRSSFHKISFYSVNYKDKSSYKIAVTHYLKLYRYHSLSGTFSFFTRMLEEDLNFWTWNHYGYVFDTGNSTFNKYGEYRNSSTLTGDVVYKLGIDSSVSAETGIFYRKLRNQYLEAKQYIFNNSAGNFYIQTNVLPDNYSSALGFTFSFKQKVTPNLLYKLNYIFRNSLSGNDLFNKIREAFPRHKVTLNVDYSPYYDFGICSRLSYFSQTRWMEFQYVKDQSSGIYDDIVKSGFIWDIALMKYFSNRLIRANVVLKNILNEKEYYNPIGAEFNLRLLVQIIINLDNLPE